MVELERSKVELKAREVGEREEMLGEDIIAR